MQKKKKQVLPVGKIGQLQSFQIVLASCSTFCRNLLLDTWILNKTVSSSESNMISSRLGEKHVKQCRMTVNRGCDRNDITNFCCYEWWSTYCLDINGLDGCMMVNNDTSNIMWHGAPELKICAEELLLELVTIMAEAAVDGWPFSWMLRVFAASFLNKLLNLWV